MATKQIELLTYDEAASRLKVSRRKLAYMLSRELFSKHRDGKNGCLFSDEIDAYIHGAASGNAEASVRNYRIKTKRIK